MDRLVAADGLSVHLDPLRREFALLCDGAGTVLALDPPARSLLGEERLDDLAPPSLRGRVARLPGRRVS